MLADEGPFSSAELAALRLQSLGLVDLAIAAQQANSFRNRVDLGANLITFSLNVTQPHVEAGSVVDLVKQVRVAAARECCLHTIKVDSQ